MSVLELIARIKSYPDSKLNLPCQSERLASSKLSQDLIEFYKHHDGCELFLDQEYCWKILPFSKIRIFNDGPEEFSCNGDMISRDWFIFLEEPNYKSKYAIDTDLSRFGYCYDVTEYNYPDILTLSFTELLAKILDLSGSYPPWYANGYVNYGDPCSPR